MTEGLKLFIDKELRIQLNYIKSRDLCDEIIKIEKVVAERFHATDPERFEREFPLLNEIQAKILNDMYEKD